MPSPGPIEQEVLTRPHSLDSLTTFPSRCAGENEVLTSSDLVTPAPHHDHLANRRESAAMVRAWWCLSHRINQHGNTRIARTLHPRAVRPCFADDILCGTTTRSVVKLVLSVVFLPDPRLKGVTLCLPLVPASRCHLSVDANPTCSRSIPVYSSSEADISCYHLGSH
jgi:hypothetical protein